MADYIGATPQNPLLGLLYGGYDYLRSPQRTQQMQGLASLLESTGLPKTIERMSYGEPLTNIGRANVPLLKPETAEAMMTVAPMAGPAARGAGRLVGSQINRAMMGEGGLLAPITPQPMFAAPQSIAREGNPIQNAVVLIGDKIFTGRTHGDALNRAVYEGAVRKEGGKYIYPKGAEVNSDLFMTNSGQIIDRLQASKMFDIGASETAIGKGLMQNKPSGSMSVDQYMEQAQAIKKQREQPSFQYPQQEALNLAQQRAALPVEQGGLGLIAENTPEMRAKAMGFDLSNPQYHATDVDFSSIRPSLQGKLGAGVYVSPNSQYAEKYTSLNAAGNARVLPLVARGKLADDDVAMNIAESIRQEMYAQNPNFSVSEWKKRTTQALTDAGYDGRSMSGLENVITNPSNLRSRFAAFDPFRKDVATATAMGVALPDLLAAEYNQQPQTSGLLYPLP
jgi:hypothetical protein